MLFRNGMRFLRNVTKPVSVFIIPHNGMSSIRFNLPVSALLVFGAVWTGVTIWAGFTAGKHFDYYVTKADNRILRAKMANISNQAEEGLAYLEMTAAPTTQLRKVLGMEAVGGGEGRCRGRRRQDELAAFRRQLSARASEIKEHALSESLKAMQQESEKRLSSYGEITLYLTDRHNGARATPNIWPTDGRVASQFGYRIHPLRMSHEFHSGLDIANDSGTPIRATADGVVRHAGWAQGYGMCVVVDHGFGYTTLYGHMSELLVKEGDPVRRGKLVGRMGSTGTSTGNHLHYEVWTGGLPVNPMKFLQVGGGAKQSGGFAGLFDGIFGGM
jgi:murein DD-endopeptidase MepM/ murein hydrolase activator NlpD